MRMSSPWWVNTLPATGRAQLLLDLTLMAGSSIQQADPLAKVEIDLASHRVRVETDEDRETIESAVVEAGYATA